MAFMKGKDRPSPGDVPRRFWWTKRLAVAYLLLIAMLLLTRWIWGHLAERRLATEIAAVEAAGGTVDWQALAPEPIPDEENAAEFYKQAAAAVTMTAVREMKFHDMLDVPSFRARFAKEADALLAANDTVFNLCRQARPLIQADWGIQYTSPAVNVALPDFAPQKELARLLRLKTLRQAEQGDSKGAVETLRDAEAQARAMGQNSLLIGHLVSLSFELLVLRSVEEVAPQLMLEDTAHPAARDAVPVDSRTLRKAIDDFLDDRLFASARRARLAEVASSNDLMEYGLVLQRNSASYGSALIFPWYLRAQAWVMRPLWRCDQAHLIKYDRLLAEAAGKDSMAHSQPYLDRADQLAAASTSDLGRLAHPTTCISMMINVGLTFHVNHAVAAERRMAAMALALRQYELVEGRPAESLADLVDKYLPTVPVDPMDPSGSPIRALLSPDKMRLYSVGRNQRDDKGRFSRDDLLGEKVDLVFFLRRGDRPEPKLLYEEHDDSEVEAGPEGQNGRSENELLMPSDPAP